MGLLSLAIWTPIAFGVLLLLIGSDQHAVRTRFLSLFGALASLAATVPMISRFVSGVGELQLVERAPWVERFNMFYHLGVDGISFWLIVLTAFITVIVVVAGWEVITERVSQYMAAFLILSGLMIGVFSAQDAMLFYVFFEATLIPMYIIIGVALITIFAGMVTVNQGTVAVITMFGKYRRILRPGLGFKIPFLEAIYKRISIQNKSVELEFQAVTLDQANVYFKSMLLFAVVDEQEETVKKVAFKFIDERSLMQALIRTVEGNIRSFVATKKQAEVLSLRREIVEHVKEQIDAVLDEWGYHLLDLQINDITFDQAIIESMSKVVASNNLKAAAENEGQALLITKTKAAEADGNAIKIAALAEKEAAMLRGQGVALFRQEVAKGMSEAAEEMKQANLDTNVILFSMWTEAIKNFAEYGKGNTIFLDGSAEGMQNTMKQIQAMLSSEQHKK